MVRIVVDAMGGDFAPPAIVGEPQVGRFHTAPAHRKNVSFIWSGDTAGCGWGIDLARGGMRTYATMLKNRPDFFIHSGDTIYADNDSGAGNVARVAPAESLAVYRAKYRENRADSARRGVRRWRGRCRSCL